MKTYQEFATNGDLFYLAFDAGSIDGHRCLDVLAYDSEDDLEADDDNTLASDRATVIDDKPASADPFRHQSG